MHQTVGRRRDNKAKWVLILGVAAQIFFNVSGGPFGSEDAIQQGGPFLTLVAFAIMPLLWSIPEALITSELATRFPHDAGYSLWPAAAFGERLGFLNGFWNLVASVTDNAVYPVLMSDYIVTYYGGDDHVPFSGFRTVVVLSFIAVMTGLNFVHFQGFSQVMVLMTLLIFLPFIFLVGFAFSDSEFKWSRLQGEPPDPAQADWAGWYNTMFWNLNCWDQISSLGNEMSDPTQILPMGLLVGLVGVISSYLFPLMAGVGLSCKSELANATSGWFVSVARQTGESHFGYACGDVLAMSVTIAAFVSCAGQYLAEMKTISLLLSGFSSCGWVPAVLERGRRPSAIQHSNSEIQESENKPAFWSTFVCTGIVVVLATQCNFQKIIALQNVPNALSTIVECLCFLKLRWQSIPSTSEPLLTVDSGPPAYFKVPMTFSILATWIIIGPVLCTAALLVLMAKQNNWEEFVAFGITTVVGLGFHAFMGLVRRNHPQWFVIPHPPDSVKDVEDLCETAMCGPARSPQPSPAASRLQIDWCNLGRKYAPSSSRTQTSGPHAEEKYWVESVAEARGDGRPPVTTSDEN